MCNFINYWKRTLNKYYYSTRKNLSKCSCYCKRTTFLKIISRIDATYNRLYSSVSLGELLVLIDSIFWSVSQTGGSWQLHQIVSIWHVSQHRSSEGGMYERRVLCSRVSKTRSLSRVEEQRFLPVPLSKR